MPKALRLDHDRILSLARALGATAFQASAGCGDPEPLLHVSRRPPLPHTGEAGAPLAPPGEAARRSPSPARPLRPSRRLSRRPGDDTSEERCLTIQGNPDHWIVGYGRTGRTAPLTDPELSSLLCSWISCPNSDTFFRCHLDHWTPRLLWPWGFSSWLHGKLPVLWGSTPRQVYPAVEEAMTPESQEFAEALWRAVPFGPFVAGMEFLPETRQWSLLVWATAPSRDPGMCLSLWMEDGRIPCLGLGPRHHGWHTHGSHLMAHRGATSRTDAILGLLDDLFSDRWLLFEDTGLAWPRTTRLVRPPPANDLVGALVRPGTSGLANLRSWSGHLDRRTGIHDPWILGAAQG